MNSCILLFFMSCGKKSTENTTAPIVEVLLTEEEITFEERMINAVISSYNSGDSNIFERHLVPFDDFLNSVVCEEKPKPKDIEAIKNDFQGFIQEQRESISGFVQQNHKMELVSFSEKTSETMKKGDIPREGCIVARDLRLTELTVKIAIAKQDAERIETEMEVMLVQVDEEQYLFGFE